MQSRRQRLHDATRDEIKQIARRQIAEQGAAALSLRAIARELGTSAPALYRYFASRDDLVTALIVDAFTSLAVHLENAGNAYPPDDYGGRLLALGLAYREWALAYRQDYTLIFGTPIPGYDAPRDITVPPATRSFLPGYQAIEAPRQAGVLRVPPEYLQPPSEEFAELARTRGFNTQSLQLAVMFHTRVHGLVSLELYDDLQPLIGDPGPFYRTELLFTLHSIGLNA